jgi:hypothetical protein
MSVIINGKTYEGSNIKVVNEKVWIDGKRVDAEPDSKSILHIEVTGTLHNLDAGGSVTCQDVAGYVDAGGSVHSGNIGGDVDAGGSVHCGKVGGNIDAGGSVSHHG